MSKIILLALCALALSAQTHVSMSSRTSVTSDKLTLAHDPSNPVTIQACIAVVNATVAGTITVQVGGTAATTTEVTPAPISPGTAPAKAKAYSNSNVGSGTATSPAYRFSANVPFPVDLKATFLHGSGTTKNMTLVIALDGSGDVVTALYHAEAGVCYNR